MSAPSGTHASFRTRRRTGWAWTLTVMATLLAACGSQGTPGPSAAPTAAEPSTTSSSATPAPTMPPPSPTPSPDPTSSPPGSSPAPTPTPTSDDPLAQLTLEQRVGQLFMVGADVSGPADDSYAAVTERHVGNVFLHGRSTDGVDATADLVESFTALVGDESTGGLPMFVATDQEGGKVQVLRGPGFSDIPAAIDQAAGTPSGTEAAAITWGAELAAAGINLNLAPVMDLVPDRSRAADNPPIGVFGRQYGYTPEDVTGHANAFSAAMMSNGVDVAIKHFPGLGRVSANTDTSRNVVDDEVTRDGPDVQIFASGIRAGAAFVMMSTAVYDLIDPTAPAAFSPIVVTDLLRGDLGFDGVVITDDVSAADQVQPWSPAERAIASIEAGVDMVLVSADSSVAAEMVDAVVAKARADAGFAAQVDAAAMRVIAAKERLR